MRSTPGGDQIAVNVNEVGASGRQLQDDLALGTVGAELDGEGA